MEQPTRIQQNPVGPQRDSVPADGEGANLASEPFVGRWNRLVSTTNWEKGRIICEWREALRAQGAAPSAYSDEAWSRQVASVTGQHVGRLRRVYQRFGSSCEDYPTLFWSHFQAALDWDDAEMWLEGAVQNGWSVAHMRRQRAETLGDLQASQTPSDDVPADWDEDVEPFVDDVKAADSRDRTERDVAEGPVPEGPDFGDESPPAARDRDGNQDPAAITAGTDDSATDEQQRPFERLADLPNDLVEAFDAFKLAILNHKMDGWTQVRCEDVLASLEALKALAVARTE